jgi:hypothetical protein
MLVSARGNVPDIVEELPELPVPTGPGRALFPSNLHDDATRRIRVTA